MWNFASQYPYLFTVIALFLIYSSTKIIASTVQWIFVAIMVAKFISLGYTFDQIKEQLNNIGNYK